MSVSGPPKHHTTIPFNIPAVTGLELPHIITALQSTTLTTNGPYTRRCESWLETHLSCPRALLTPSGTAALHLAALILDLRPADEVILPTYTHPATANAFLLRGATPVFIDIVPETMTLDTNRLREALTPRTRAVVAMHYAGMSCDMDAIAEAVRDYSHRHSHSHDRGVHIVEDAAEGLFAMYKGREAGTMGALGCLSFDGGGNVTAGGQGGAVLVNDAALRERAEMLRDQGVVYGGGGGGGERSTDELVYAWQAVGGNFVLGELQAAFLWGQLEGAEAMQIQRHRVWNLYWKELEALEGQGVLQLPRLPARCEHNASLFFVKVRDAAERRELMEALKEIGITVLPHYSPLHEGAPGRRFRYVASGEGLASRESERLLCLPIYYALTVEDARVVADSIRDFYSGR
ncbi:DegT/DnrJ/EryC1/StrS aminotransferase family protein [Aspergillus clavatus NRRL 1]|uniref:DegT/DnrJ/EryC1/StrS aminotransferase family protein n=1 Tax=Aspergillus clavatus (strain ATCC 1007 / CBS 513.65 / DSM 816 / NCTC 3887 / NRRL 1 / QM 1276 / 107) TaxID=344612 RepID=A1C8L2_ASPCL|nr:DegT/DnrJ/EryC1/StrS aminotransferase family protein [Aspergillus clavatus NRRL 1]EAW13649.1 DegT/DnrJ/EryC1/StrS aminotransferase family protein [Aspergillus clavatus NRRL 1]